MAAPPTPVDLEAAIREALEGAALEDITQRSLRTTLEERFGQDLTDQKAAIKDITIRVLSQQEEGGEEEEDGSSSDSDDSSSGDEEEEEGGGATKTAKKKASSKKGGGFNKEYAWSEEMTAFLGQGYMSRPQVTKATWAYIKQHKLQNPSDKRQILCDPTLQRLFGVESVGMFQMAKFINKHLREDERGVVKEETGGDSDDNEEEEDTAVAKKGKGKSKKTGKGGGGGGFNKERAWSEEMAAFLGTGYMSQPQVTKAMWAHIKQHNLQDPSDKRQILCDPTLQRLFGVESVGMFQMAKYIKTHMREDERGVVKEEETGGDSDDGNSGGGGSGGGKRKAGASAAAKPEKKAKKQKQKGEGSGRGFPAEKLSPLLAEVVGKAEAPRNEVVKALWAHIKTHKLQDPSDGRQIICDAQLKQLFGVDRVSGFGMNKYLAAHFLGRA